jgi:hypothetical protein
MARGALCVTQSIGAKDEYAPSSGESTASGGKMRRILCFLCLIATAMKGVPAAGAGQLADDLSAVVVASADLLGDGTSIDHVEKWRKPSSRAWFPAAGRHTHQSTVNEAAGEESAGETGRFGAVDTGRRLPASRFNREKDLISLHYDHCADPDDGHATAADRTISAYYGLRPHVVSGTYGWQQADKDRKLRYQSASEAVSRAAWGANWLNAHADWNGSVQKTAEIWRTAIAEGGHIWISEAGQSDFSAEVLRRLHQRYPPKTTKTKIHLIQHSSWNEKYTTPELLTYVKKYTDYIKIDTGNRGDNATAGLMLRYNHKTSAIVDAFMKKAEQSEYRQIWQAAFSYLDPGTDQGWPEGRKLDFSDTVELLYILGIDKEIVADCTDFADIFFMGAGKRLSAGPLPPHQKPSARINNQP